MTLLALDNVVKHFATTAWAKPWRRTTRTVHAVDGVTFNVNHGEAVAVVGESGCGKSSIGNLVLRLLRPTFGEIRFHDKDIAKLRGQEWLGYRRGVQAVFQDPWSALDPRWTIGRLIAEPMVVAKSHSAAQAKARIGALLEEVGLDPAHAQRYPHQFSGGQRQRIAIACAMSTRPELVVLDEPVSALDMSVRAGILNLLLSLQARHGMAYIFIAHDLAAVRLLAQRVLVMYLGEIVESGPTERVFNEPLHPYTKALLSASRAMTVGNRIAINSPEWRRNLLLLDGELPSPSNPPAGCRFHTRCPTATEVCGRVKPQFLSVGVDRAVSACAGCVLPLLDTVVPAVNRQSASDRNAKPIGETL